MANNISLFQEALDLTKSLQFAEMNSNKLEEHNWRQVMSDVRPALDLTVCRKQCCREIEAYLWVTPLTLCAAVNKNNATPSCKKVGNSIIIRQLLLLCTALVGKALSCCLYFQRAEDTYIFKELQK